MLEIFNRLKLFFEDNYVRINVREYARLQKISPPHASTVLKRLEKESLLLKKEERGYHFFYANREEPLFVKLQQAYYQQKLKELIYYLEEEFAAPLVILFGSLARAEVSRNSDIDLAVFSATKKKVNLKKFEELYGREVQLFTFGSRKELNKNEELLNNILGGAVLSGSW